MSNKRYWGDDPTANAAVARAAREERRNTKPIRFSLPLPPSVNHYYLTTHSGKRIMTQTAQQWMEEAKWMIRKAKTESGWCLVERRKVILRLWAYWPDNRRRDMGNLHKAICDAPEKILYDDDRLVLVRDMDYDIDKKNPRIEIEIMEAGAIPERGGVGHERKTDV